MHTPEPPTSRSVNTSTWTPPLPDAPGFEHLMVETPGLRGHVATIGEGEPVVLLHGFPQHWWQWRTVAPAIATAGYRVYCPDLRGAGWTTAASPKIERETRLHDLLALFDALGIERAHVVSHDMGVITAMQLTYDHPERVRTAVQLSVPPPFMTLGPKFMSGFRHLPQFVWHRPGTPLRGIFSEAYVARQLPESTIDAHLAPLSRPEVDGAVRRLTRGMILPEAMRMARGVYRGRRLTVPTLALFGRRDHPWTEQNVRGACRKADRYADRFELAFVDDAAHFITDDAPTAVADLAVSWFSQAT